MKKIFVNKKMNFQSGFTLIELLVVITIIGILVAVGVSSYNKATKLSRDAKRKADIEQLRQALETFRSETGAYPTTGAGLNALKPTYIQNVPTDPKASSGYTYGYSSTATTYNLCGYLELPAGATACGAALSCGTPGNCNYGTTQP